MADFEVWRREEGYWYGEYTFLGAEGDPYVSSSWNYPYDHYYGFIHIELDGNALKQRNVFIYPPQDPDKCSGTDDSTEGDGVCGVNGNEKVFGADHGSNCSVFWKRFWMLFRISRTFKTRNAAFATSILINRARLCAHR